MATIKTTGTGSGLRVLTKTSGGVQRVSCSCCEAVCCMYPADQLGVDFTNDDLPDNLTVNGSSLSRAGSAYGNMTNGVIFESGVWALYTDGNRSTSNCLILGDGNFTAGDNSVEDQFAATYDIDWIGGGTLLATVTRASLCCWEGVGSFGYRYKLQYQPVIGSSPYWFASFAMNNQDFTCGGSNIFDAADFKYDALGSPIGTYVGGTIVSL